MWSLQANLCFFLGRTRGIDFGSVHSRQKLLSYTCLLVGYGLYGRLIEAIEIRRWLPGKIRYSGEQWFNVSHLCIYLLINVFPRTQKYFIYIAINHLTGRNKSPFGYMGIDSKHFWNIYIAKYNFCVKYMGIGFINQIYCYISIPIRLTITCHVSCVCIHFLDCQYNLLTSSYQN